MGKKGYGMRFSWTRAVLTASIASSVLIGTIGTAEAATKSWGSPTKRSRRTGGRLSASVRCVRRGGGQYPAVLTSPHSTGLEPLLARTTS